jgi:hypothetical protein
LYCKTEKPKNIICHAKEKQTSSPMKNISCILIVTLLVLLSLISVQSAETERLDVTLQKWHNQLKNIQRLAHPNINSLLADKKNKLDVATEQFNKLYSFLQERKDGIIQLFEGHAKANTMGFSEDIENAYEKVKTATIKTKSVIGDLKTAVTKLMKSDQTNTLAVQHEEKLNQLGKVVAFVNKLSNSIHSKLNKL